MCDLTVKKLDNSLVHQANSNSFNGTRGDGSEHDYHVYANKILSWNISDEKKRKLLDMLYEKWCVILRNEARHISVMVAGPARYNAKRFDHSDAIIRCRAECAAWFEELEKQLEQSGKQADEVQRIIEMIAFCDSRDELRPDSSMMKLATLDSAKYVELFEKLQSKYKWRKNSNLYKLYDAAKSGTLQVVRKEVFFEDANLTAYRKSDRAYIKFVMRPARQLIVALKSRGWWWNSHEEAWSIYLNKVDGEWVKSISTRYEKYI